jgi:hypothetical protein
MSLILDGSNGLSDVDGTAATPAIRGTDTNTGIFFPAADTIAFATGGTTAVTVDTSQNVTFAGNTTISKAQAISFLNSTTGTNSVYSQYTNTSGNAYIGINNSTGGDFGNAAYALQVFHGGAYPIVFSTANTERMRIDSSGRALFGTTTTSIAGSGAFITPADGRITQSTGAGGIFAFYLNASGTEIGRISNNSNSSTTYSTSSDYRLKENIAPMTGALGLVQQLKPVTYNWKVDGSNGQGFIAHELAEVCPDCVVGDKDAVDADGKPQYQGIDTSFLVATLTAAIQELKTELDSVKAELATLKAQP